MNVFKYIITYVLIVFVSSYAFSQVYTSDSVFTINSITTVGNKITKDKIILRELEFTVGNKVTNVKLDSLIIKSKQNLLNKSLFNFVTITKSTLGYNCNIIVSVTERWYVWPIPILQFADRNINTWINKQDLSRINYGIDLRIDNFRGLMENLNIVAQGGYDVVLAFRWSIPYITKNQVFGMGFAGGIQLNHEIAYQTIDNKEQYYKSENSYAQKIKFAATNLTFRPEYNYSFGVSLGFNQYVFQDTILRLNPDFAGKETMYNYFNINIGAKIDFRDYKPYPLNGYYFDIRISKKGLGIFNDDINYFSVGANFDQYVHIYNRWYFAYNFGAKFTNQNTRSPFFIKTGLGYHPITIRGYELYVVNGQKIGKFKSNIKFEIVPRKTFNINWIKTTKFSEVFFEVYANIFFDVAYVEDIYTQRTNPLSNQLLWSTGVGFDLVTYYDLVLRLELSLNKQKQTNVFISFVAPI